MRRDLYDLADEAAKRGVTSGDGLATYIAAVCPEQDLRRVLRQALLVAFGGG